MAQKTIGIIMNGVSGRMGYRQHLVRSILAIREEGGVLLADGRRVQLEPVLIGRNDLRLKEIADRHCLTRWTTDLAEALDDHPGAIYFDAQVTSQREEAILSPIKSGMSGYSGKRIAEALEGALRLADAARAAGVKNGVVHDKLYLPGLRKL